MSHAISMPMRTRDLTRAALICTKLLSSPGLEQRLLHGSWVESLPSNELRDLLYREQYGWTARVPDHVFESCFQELRAKGLADGCLASKATSLIADEYLQMHAAQVVCKLDSFGAWQQGVVSRVSALALIAAAHAKNQRHGGYVLSRVEGGSHSQSLQSLSVVTPMDSAVEDWISRHGLNETHLHLNGSTHGETCWLRALREPDKEVKKYSELWQKSRHESRRIKELAHISGGGLSPVDLRRRLRLGKKLRSWLIAAATGQLDASTPLPVSAQSLMDEDALVQPWTNADLGMYALGRGGPRQEVAAELHWMVRLLTRLQSDYLPRLDRMLHLYLLLQNRCRQMLVQSEEQYGFDQFQKFTYTDLRDAAELCYSLRLLEMHGVHKGRSQTAYLEGRFAPKETASKNVDLLCSILGAYLRYLEPNGPGGKTHFSRNFNEILSALEAHSERAENRWPARQQLCLVAHFIKKPWSMKEKGPYRFFKLRRDLEVRANAIGQCLTQYPRLRRWLRGVDAAANEMHAPPEVFAATFRRCERMGLGHKTFHVGEDFPHLMTGIRQMLDAVELLDLCNGARIGHGTAMGIDPQLWISRMPAELMLTRGDYLLDLLAAWKLLRKALGGAEHAYQAECLIAGLLPEVFGERISPSEFEQAMALRGLHMDALMQQQSQGREWEPNDSVLPWMRHERQKVADAARKNPKALALLWRWHSDQQLWRRSEELITVPATSALFDASCYLLMQQELMRLLVSKSVVVETLPSSNVRISQYESFMEHHALRWMRVPGYLKDGDPEVLVSLGSDDPGIFANDLRSDFYHLYAVMRGLGLSDNDALARVGALNERGRQYRFHEPAL